MKKILVCVLPVVLAACHINVVNNTCTDGELDGNESDVDCGGSCAACADGAACLADADCASAFCGSNARCATPVTTGVPSSTGADVYPIDDGASIVVNPGVQAGYGITANTGGSYRIVWTGDSGTSGGYREFTGTVWTAGKFDSITPGCAGGSCALESGDTVSPANVYSDGSTITFDTIATDNLDGFDFTSTVEPVYFDLLIDGTRRETLVFFSSGGVGSSPATIPFGLQGQ